MEKRIKEMMEFQDGKATLEHALQSKWFGTQWICENNDYDTLNWLSNDVEKPSKSEIDAEIASIQTEWDSLEYTRSRKAEYPSIEELVVALYDDDDKAAVDEKRAAIKAKYAKP